MRWAHILVAAWSVGCGSPPDGAEPIPERWHVSDGALRDPTGRAVVLRGANVSSVHKRAPYFDFHELGDYQRMRDDWGMNTVRFLIEWQAIEPEPDAHDAAYLDEVARRVALAGEAGLLVVLDMHQDLYGEGFGGNGAPAWTCDQSHYDAFVPTQPWFANYANEHVTACYDTFWSSEELRGHYVEAWRRVAARLATEPAVIGFDVMNEPYWGSTAPGRFEEDVLPVLYDAVVAAVRAEAPDWVAFLEPAASRNLGIQTSLQPRPYPDVVYAPHSYDGQAEAGEGFDPARRDAVVTGYELFRAEADWLDAGLWIGEYGGIAADGGIGAYMDAQYDGAGAVAAGTTYWHYSKDDGYGLLDAAGEEKPELLAALVRPYPARVGGELRSYAYDEGARTLTVRLVPEPAIAAATELVVPARVYPDGVEVECGGCSVTTLDQRVGLTELPAGAELTVTVRPR